jgi:hypothetical protein
MKAKPGAAVDDKPERQSSLTEQTKTSEQINLIEAFVQQLQHAYPLLCQHYFPEGTAAAARLHPHVLVDVNNYMKHQNTFVVAFRQVAAHEQEHGAVKQGKDLVCALAEASIDKTLHDALVQHETAVKVPLTTMHRVYGLLPLGYLCFIAARPYHTPMEPLKNTYLSAAAKNFNLKPGTYLDVATPLSSFRLLLEEAVADNTKCNWTEVYKDIVQNVAAVGREPDFTRGSDGTKISWGQVAWAIVKKSSARGRQATSTQQDVVALADKLHDYVRHASQEFEMFQSMTSERDRTFNNDVMAAEQSPPGEVNLLSLERRRELG